MWDERVCEMRMCVGWSRASHVGFRDWQVDTEGIHEELSASQLAAAQMEEKVTCKRREVSGGEGGHTLLTCIALSLQWICPCACRCMCGELVIVH